MSADNLIGVFIFSDGLCKVKHFQAVDNIHHSMNPLKNGEYNHAFIYSLLKNEEFVDYDTAFKIAVKLEKEYGFIEYGIAPFNFEFDWEELKILAKKDIEEELPYVAIPDYKEYLEKILEELKWRILLRMVYLHSVS